MRWPWYTDGAPTPMDISSTKDLLYLALILAILVFTGFFCWFFYYLIAILRDARQVTKEVSSGITKIHQILDTIKETLSASSSHLALLVGGVKEILGFYQRRRHDDDTEEDDERPSKRRKR